MQMKSWLWMNRLGLALAVALTVNAAVTASAEEALPVPQGKVILTISGNIEKTNQDGVAAFDHAMLEAIGFSDLQTSTAWTAGTPTFRGVPMQALLEHLGAKGENVTAVALNDYKVEIPFSDIFDYPVLLASSMDGERLKVRDKGPLWIVYPQDDFADLRNKVTQSKWAWQVKELMIE